MDGSTVQTPDLRTKSIEIRQNDPALLDAGRVPRNAEVVAIGDGQLGNLALSVWMHAISPGRGSWSIDEVNHAWFRWRQRVHAASACGWRGIGWAGAPFVCRPPGTRLKPNTGWRYCDWRLCLFCHARRAAKAYWALRRSIERVDRASSVWRCRYNIKHLRDSYNWFKRHKIAAGYTGRVSARPMTVANSVTAVVVVGKDHRPPDTDVQQRYGLITEAALYRACTTSFRYPDSWLRADLGTFQALEWANRKGGRAWVPYGACRKPYTLGDGVYNDEPDPIFMEEWGLEC